MPDKRSYSASRFGVELDGKLDGLLESVSGGEPYLTVLSDAAGPSGVIAKHPGVLAYEPVQLSFGSDMGAGLSDWISSWLSGKPSTHDLAIVFADYDYRETSRLEVDEASISELRLPALAGGSTDPARFGLTLVPTATRYLETGGGVLKQAVVARTGKALAGNFRLSLGSLPTKLVASIEPITITQVEGGVEVSEVVLSVSQADARPYREWFNTTVKGLPKDSALQARVELLAHNVQTSLVTVDLGDVGIARVADERHQTNAEVMKRIRVELFCSRVSLTVATGGVLPAPDPVPAKKPAAPARTPAEIAERLGTKTSAPAALTPREVGVALGARWAGDAASLPELQALAALEPAAWDAVLLPEGHSLLTLLAEDGVIPPGPDDALELGRSSFVEGLVAGAAEVLRQVQPLLHSRSTT